MNLKELWRPVVGYEGLYEVSNWGRVKSLNYRHTGREEILKPILQGKPGNQYYAVKLYKNGKGKSKRVHQLVAQAFLKPVEGKDYVDHIKGNNLEDPFTNAVWNLRWCTKPENNGFPLARENQSKAMKLRWNSPDEREKLLKAANRPEVKEKKSKALKGKFINHPDLSKAVLQFTKDGLFVAEFPSTREAARQTGYNQRHISECCRGRHKTHSGFIWRYKDAEAVTSTPAPKVA